MSAEGPDERAAPRPAERRRRVRRERQLSIFDERRLGERRRRALDVLDRLRAFLGLPPLAR